MTMTINGCGTKLYGQCDWRHDGSHRTTKWFVLAYFPVLPLGSLRIRNAGGNRYHILEELPLSMAQVGRIYGFALINAVLLSTLLPAVISVSDSHWADPVKLIVGLLLVATACAPFGWLIWSRRRAAAEALQPASRPRPR